MKANTDPGADPSAPPTPEDKRSFSGERYRARWRWDNVVKGTHLLNCWYQRSCAYNVYVKDGAVVFEEPVGKYPRTNSSVPDFNPRGCQKGACYALNMNQPARVTHPLKRVGARGEGSWQQVSWDEAPT
ncbi:MAG: molybdopterin-dependent oxidoreductase, partial [Chloroflexi bacterium]|nr:molybdopterin-dependent oxidoreductase [Chloroflexota bacterium]